MTEVRLRGAADADLAAILAYSLDAFGREIAEDYLRSFDQAFDLLRRHPSAGAMNLNVDPPIRALPHRSHRIFYDLEGDTIWIVRILHHAMDAERHIDRAG